MVQIASCILRLFGIALNELQMGWRNYKGAHPETSEQPHLNQRSAQYIGQVYKLSEPIVQGYGKAFVGDGAWKVRGPELPAGASVRVRAVEGALLIVEAA